MKENECVALDFLKLGGLRLRLNLLLIPPVSLEILNVNFNI